MRNSLNDTIAAIATAVSNSGISIIRVSGDDAVNVVDRCFYVKGKNETLKNADSHTVHYGLIKRDDEIIDEVLVILMKAPRSFTCENVVEVDCHGGALVTKRVLERVLECGCRLAEPGEFTKRAFLNGRIDLSQAEAVADIIESKTESAMKNSINLLKGNLKTEIYEIRESILKDVAFIEAALDDPEHIEIDGFSEELLIHVEENTKKINMLIANAEEGRYLKEGIKVAIVGKPNAGKSSLLNSLTGEDRAIVTDIEGTTRDSLEEEIILNGINLKIIDTAGIRNTNDIIEKMGVERAVKAAEDADLILYMIDISVEMNDNDYLIEQKIKDKRVIVLLNKSDLTAKVDSVKLKEKWNKVINISTLNKTGLSELKDAIEEYFFKKKIDTGNNIYITNVHQKEALVRANEALGNVKDAINNNMSEDFMSIDLMGAYEALGEIIGESLDEELINKIFSDFCMGK